MLCSYQLSDGETPATLDNGQKIVVTVNQGIIDLNTSAQVVAANNVASNGVAHIVNGVLVPSTVMARYHLHTAATVAALSQQ